MKNVWKLLAKSVLIPLELTAPASETDGAINKKIFGPRRHPLDLGLRSLDLVLCTTTLTSSTEEINDIMKRLKSLEESCLLIKGVSEIIKNEIKEQKEGFLSMLLGASLLGNLLTGNGTIRAGEDTTGQGF